MTKRYTSISWLHFNRLLDGGMSSDEAYEKAYGPPPHDEADAAKDSHIAAHLPHFNDHNDAL